MAQFTHDDVQDAACDLIATCVTVTVCSDQPADLAGIAAVALAEVTVTAGDGNGDWVVAAGDVSGRKVTLQQQAGVSITASGEADHIAFDDGTTLLHVATCNAQALTSGGTVTIPALDIEFEDPS
jgi:hypothetical protein